MNEYERSQRSKRRRHFGETWWGNAWVEAVEHHAELEQSRLARGRTYARWNYVGALQIEAGVVRARVAGSQATPYHTYVKLTMFTDAQWNAFLDVISAKVAHAATLMDGELTSTLIEDARDAGVELLPVAGDLSTGCSCPDDADTCKHAAAVCYLIADTLDDDPFALLQMRGRTREEVIGALRSRRHHAAHTEAMARAARAIADVEANEVFLQHVPRPLPRVPIAPPRPGMPPALTDVPENSEIDPADLDDLARATAQRAWEMCSGLGDSGFHDTSYRDLVRRLAPLLDTPHFDVLCSRTKRIRNTVERDARNWPQSLVPPTTSDD